MNNIRREVCKRANVLVKFGYTKSAAFKKAWEEAKKAANTIKVADLVIGQTIRIEYGDFDNLVTCTVTDISKELFLDKYYTIRATSEYGSKIEFVAAPDETVNKAA